MEEVQKRDETLSRHSRHTEVDDWHHLSNYCHAVLFTQRLQSQRGIIWVGFKSLTRQNQSCDKYQLHSQSLYVIHQLLYKL